MLRRSTAYPGLRLRSLPRSYPAGINLVNEGRPDLLYIRINNRGNQSVYFWHGPVPTGTDGQGGSFLPLDPAEWTASEVTDAESLLLNFGEEIPAGSIWEPSCAHTGRVYSFVDGATNRSHVIVGLQADQEQGKGGHQYNGG